MANTIHNLSKRAGKQFVKVDFGVMPESLIESELFGYERGAFTGAERKRKGYFELAHGGTIFIDELQNVSAFMQSKLLSVVEERKIYPVGRIDPVEIDVRIIAATNRDIRKSIIENQLREDLFFRLGEFIITLPPLKERRGDIPFFANKFLNEAAVELNKQMKEIDEEALNYLNYYSWPGNIRELKNVIRRAVLLSDDGVVRKSQIKFSIEHRYEEKESGVLFPLKDALISVERKTIRDALVLSNGNKSKAASLLNVDYKTLLNKIKEYNLQ